MVWLIGGWLLCAVPATTPRASAPSSMEHLFASALSESQKLQTAAPAEERLPFLLVALVVRPSAPRELTSPARCTG